MKIGPKGLRRAALGWMALLSSTVCVFAQTGVPSDSERIQRLEELVRQLQAAKDNLQAQVNELKGSNTPSLVTNVTGYPADVQRTAPTSAGPVLTNLSSLIMPLGKGTTLKVGGFLQGNAEFGDVGAFSGNFPDNPVGGTAHVPLHNRFRLRRARINLSGDIYELFDFKLEGDFAQTDGTTGNRSVFSGTDLFGNWHQFPEINLRVGQFKAPFGWEQTTPDTTLYTAERSLPTGALAPERQVGLQLWGTPLAHVAPEHKDLVEYAAGIFNGNGRNFTINDDPWFMYVGRLSLKPYKGKLFGQPTTLRLGVDGMTSRYASGTRISPSDNLKMDTLDGSLSGFTAPADTDSVGWDLNESFALGPFELISEYIEQHFNPQNSSAYNEFTANGYYVQGSYFFPGKKFQVVAKWSSLNPGQAAEDEVNSMLGGINWYIRGDSIKLMCDYVHTWSEFRENHSGTGNDNFDEVVLRLQLMF